MTEKTRFGLRQVIAILVLVAILLCSLFVVSDTLSSPEFHSGSILALDDKKATVVGLTATTAAASIAVSAIPGDATTPIANQIAELSSYLLVVTGIIMLEEFLLPMTCYLTFTWLIPIACGLGILYVLFQVAYLKKLAARLVLFGLAICLVIPVSIRVSNMFEETFNLKQTIAEAEQASEDTQSDAQESGQAENQTSGIGGLFSQIGEAVTGTVTKALDSAKNTLNRFIDAVAVLVISNCVIPVLVLFVFLELAKAALPQSFDGVVRRVTDTASAIRSRGGKRQMAGKSSPAATTDLKVRSDPGESP